MRNNLALSLALAGNDDEAIDMLRELSRELGAGPRVRQNLALVYALAGRAEDAAAMAQHDFSGARLRHNLALYDAPELRAHALNAVCVESSRGLRLAKEKSSRKIDGLVALAMAAVAALDTPRAEPSPFPPSGTPGPCRIAAFGWDGTPAGRLSRVDWHEPW